jgi:riboflavin kinase/FMN adenylyltransferase
MVCLFGRPISSSWIKELLSKGEAEKAAKILSRPYSVHGSVERGEGRGRLLGCPTANLVIDPKKYTPMLGVYAGFARVEGKVYRAVANIGQKPTFGDERLSLEVHLIGFEGDLYGRQMPFEFLKFLRGQKLFHSPTALAEQIQRDIKEASAVLGADFGVSS